MNDKTIRKYSNGYFSIVIYVLFSCIILLFSVGYMLFLAIDKQEKSFFSILEDSDLRYLRETIGKGRYYIKDGCLFVGNTCLGDGTLEKANQDIFKNYTRLTGAHCFVYMRCSDEGLGWCKESSDLDGGYFEGHYICVCDSVGIEGEESCIGWKLPKKNADRIEIEEKYSFVDDFLVDGDVIKQVSRLQAIKDLATNEIIAVVAVTRNVNNSSYVIQKLSINLAFAVLVIVIVIASGLAFLVSKHTEDLRKTINYLSKIDSGNLPKESLTLSSKGTMADVEQAVNKMVASLKYNKRVSEELELATGIQNSMLPKNFDELNKKNKFYIYGNSVPAKEVGGDFYDFFMLDDDHLVLVIADVSGKGVPAAMQMAVARTLIRNLVLMGFYLSEVFTKVNNLISANDYTNMFITAWLGVIDLKTNTLTFVNAGHNPPLLCRNNKYEYLHVKSDLVLGVMDDYKYKTNTLDLEPGDRLLVYTDGVTESRNEKSEFFGDNRFIDFLNEKVNENPKDLIESIYDKLKEFSNGNEQSDDITILCVELKKT